MSAAPELLDLLDHARRTSPFYADRIPHDLGSAADAERLLAGIPLLSRQDIQRQGPRLWSTEGAGRGDWRVVRTTGTTDEPVEVIVDDRGRRTEAAALAAHIDRCLGTPDWRERDIIHLALHPGASSTALPSPWSAGARIVKWNLVWAWQRSDASFVDALSHIGGNVVTAMPSVIELLCSRLAATGRTVAPLLVVLSGQTVDAHVREAARQALGCRPTSLYTLAEAGIVASECEPTGGYHVEDPAAVVEIVDDKAGRYRRAARASSSSRRCRTGRCRSSGTAPATARRGPTGHAAADEPQASSSSRQVGAQAASSPVGGDVDVGGFGKVLAGLSVNRIHVDQGEAGEARARTKPNASSGRRPLGSRRRSARGIGT